MIKYLKISTNTGQATEPILKTGCDYTAIELGENFTSFLKHKFSSYPNFRVKQSYQCRMEYKNALQYGFANLVYKEWKSERMVDAETYISWISTHCEHITLEEPYKTRFYAGIREAFRKYGDRMVIIDTIPLYLVQKP